MRRVLFNARNLKNVASRTNAPSLTTMSRAHMSTFFPEPTSPEEEAWWKAQEKFEEEVYLI